MNNKPRTAVRDFGALRAAIDANPHLYSARLSLDYQAIVSELNQHLPDGKWITLHDAKLAMALRPAAQPAVVAQATGTAVGRVLFVAEREFFAKKLAVA